MDQKEMVGGLILVAALIIVVKIAGIVMKLFSSIFWVIALCVAAYAFINPTFRNSLLSAFRYVYKRVFGN